MTNPKKAKWHVYAITLAVAVAFLARGGFRSLTILDDFFIGYGLNGHIIILVVSFVAAFYLGLTNARMKWLYPFLTAFFVWFVFPFIVLMYNRALPRYQHGFAYWVFIGFVIIFLPHLLAPLLGVIFGKLFHKRRTKTENNNTGGTP